MKLFNSLTQKILNNPQQLLMEKRWIKDKYIILKFMQFYHAWKLYVPDNQKSFEYFTHVLRNNPHLFSRTIQLSMDGIWEKNHLPISNFPKSFLNFISIEDPYNTTHDHFLIGDVWNYHNIEILCKEMFFDHNNKIVLHLTPRETLNKADSSIKKLIVMNEQYTSNTAVDVYIDEIPYDFKNSPDIHYLKNNIHILELGECTLKKINGYVHALNSRLNSNLYYSDECQAYSMLLINGIKSRINENKSPGEILNYINNTLRTKTPPQGFSIARIIERVETMRDKPTFETLEITEQEAEMVNKIPLNKGNITTNEVKNAQKAIMGILENIEPSKKKSIIGAGIVLTDYLPIVSNSSDID